MRRLDGITKSVDIFEQTLGDSEATGKPGVLQSMGSQRARLDLGTEQQIETLINEKEVI